MVWDVLYRLCVAENLLMEEISSPIPATSLTAVQECLWIGTTSVLSKKSAEAIVPEKSGTFGGVAEPYINKCRE